jgi:curved DNA-binding protein
MEFKDYYKIMGLERDASPDEIKRAYRRLARKYHPDVSKEADAEKHFKEVQEAYTVLKDPEKRRAYDQVGKHWKVGQEFHTPPNWGREFSFSAEDFTGGEVFSDFFETLFGRARTWSGDRGGGTFSVRGQDQQAHIQIDLEQAFHGTLRSFTLTMPEMAPEGQMVKRSRSLKVKIPPGVIDGQRIRLAGQGAPGMGGAPAGDLYLEVELSPHRLFRADKRDIHIELPITPWEAALGRKVKVPTLGGIVDLNIPAGSQSGRKLRLKGRGLPGKVSGDQIVTLKIVTPPADTVAAKAFYEHMERELPMDPRVEIRY